MNTMKKNPFFQIVPKCILTLFAVWKSIHGFLESQSWIPKSAKQSTKCCRCQCSLHGTSVVNHNYATAGKKTTQIVSFIGLLWKGSHLFEEGLNDALLLFILMP